MSDMGVSCMGVRVKRWLRAAGKAGQQSAAGSMHGVVTAMIDIEADRVGMSPGAAAGI